MARKTKSVTVKETNTATTSVKPSINQKKKTKQWLTEGNWVLKGSSITQWMRRYLLEQCNNHCEICDLDANDWNGRSLVLECDHIDGDYKNNARENLRMICPNCHTQTETYKAKNTGRGRPR